MYNNASDISSGLSINPTPQPHRNYFGSLEPNYDYRFNPGGYSSFKPQILPSSTSLYYYTYSYGNGDTYSGYTYDTTGKYIPGSNYDYSSASNETGNNGQYYISGAYSGYDNFNASKGLVYVTSYYDSESQTTTTSSSSYYGTSYYGANGLGSEYGYLTSTNSTTDDLFGGDYYEADIATNTISDWFSQNVKDSGLQSTARSYFTDAALDRNDLISIFRTAEDGSLVDSTELTDLRTLVSNSSYLGITDHVQILANKVVNSDIANQRYQGASLGNLYAGSSNTQMENLISKWFLGSDRPITPYSYQYASGSLFQNGVSYEDVRQGSVGDCYFLAGLAETAYRSSSTIESMFINNGDNTYTVRFYKNGAADYVTVDSYLPTDWSGSFVYANYGSLYSNSSNELWVALAEKAYAQINESGWISQDNTNSYEGISGGYAGDAFKHITGRNASWGYLDANSIISAFNSGQLVSLATNQNVFNPEIVSGHAYAVIGYDSSTQKLTLFNPWGINNGTSKPGTIELTWSEIMASFSYWEYTIT